MQNTNNAYVSGPLETIFEQKFPFAARKKPGKSIKTHEKLFTVLKRKWMKWEPSKIESICEKQLCVSYSMTWLFCFFFIQTHILQQYPHHS